MDRPIKIKQDIQRRAGHRSPTKEILPIWLPDLHS